MTLEHRDQGPPMQMPAAVDRGDVRHSYPLAISDAGFGTAVSLLLRTLPYALTRFAILVAISILTIIWAVVTFGGFAFLAERVNNLTGTVWFVAGTSAYGYVWWMVVRYFLYLLKAGHVAVLTELITTDQIAHGQEGMFAYGKRVVTERFGEVNALFVVDTVVDGVVKAFNRTLNWVANLLPIPGLSSITQIVGSIVFAAATYIDETIFSYGLARKDPNPWSNARDGLVYYAQNAKEVLKTGIWIVVLDKVLTAVVWVVMLAPAFAVAFVLPKSIAGGGTAFALFIAVLFASNIRAAFLKPLFLIMVMTKFHVTVRNQGIDPNWDQRLTQVSDKFRKIKDSIPGWKTDTSPTAAPASAQP
jgi:hypothetical protein